MRFNMGCGRNRLAGFHNVDGWAGCEPDEAWDLERTPWPWPDDCAEEVVFHHSLEHMGGEPAVFLAIMAELYRICRDGALVRIDVPHPRHDNFISDPTHVRAITGATLRLFDRKLNDEWQASGAANSLLAQRIGVDFELVGEEAKLADDVFGPYTRGELSEAAVRDMLLRQNNVATELKFVLRVRKAPRLG